MSKINWAKALTRYISDSSVSYRDVASEFGVSHTAVEKRARLENWLQLREETMIKLRQKLPEKLGEEIAAVKAREAQIGKMYQGQAVQFLNEKKPDGTPVLKAKSLEEASMLGYRGVMIERMALDLNEEKTSSTAIQINFGSEEVERWAT